MDHGPVHMGQSVCREHHILRWGRGDRLLSYLILLQERSSPQDPSTLALRIWNNMVSVEMCGSCQPVGWFTEGQPRPLPLSGQARPQNLDLPMVSWYRAPSCFPQRQSRTPRVGWLTGFKLHSGHRLPAVPTCFPL